MVMHSLSRVKLLSPSGTFDSVPTNSFVSWILIWTDQPSFEAAGLGLGRYFIIYFGLTFACSFIVKFWYPCDTRLLSSQLWSKKNITVERRCTVTYARFHFVRTKSQDGNPSALAYVPDLSSPDGKRNSFPDGIRLRWKPVSLIVVHICLQCTSVTGMPLFLLS